MLLTLLFITIVVSYIGTYSVEKFFLKYSLFIDTPSDKSIHKNPTPTAGGISILLSYFLYIFMLLVFHELFIPWYDGHPEYDENPFFILMVSLFPLIIIGLIDDFNGVNIGIRLFTQFFSAVIIIYFFQVSNTTIDFREFTNQTALLIIIVSIIMSIWLTNLYNFMDGIDGYASLECIFVSFSAAFLAYINKPESIISLYIFGLGLANIGFLIRNWSPAKIFMGDTGSISLGFILAFLIFYSASESALSIYTWLILLSVFIADASYTLVVRIVTKKNIFQAHLNHAFHIVTKNNNSHTYTNKVLIAINIIWVLPLAIISNIYIEYNVILTIAVYIPFIFYLINIGAGLEKSGNL